GSSSHRSAAARRRRPSPSSLVEIRRTFDTNGVRVGAYPAVVAKTAVKYACGECGYTAGRWFGKCPGCNAFGTLIEESPDELRGGTAPKPLLRLVDVDAAEAQRIATGVPELDRVLGGGLVPASLVLVGGEPGVGKSTLLLMALRAMSASRRVVL